jgi:hypothetical protein
MFCSRPAGRYSSVRDLLGHRRAGQETHFQRVAAHEVAHEIANCRMRATAVAAHVDDHGVAAFEKAHCIVVGTAGFVLDPFEAGYLQIADVAAEDRQLRQAVMTAERLPPPQGLAHFHRCHRRLWRPRSRPIDDQRQMLVAAHGAQIVGDSFGKGAGIIRSVNDLCAARTSIAR